MEKNELAKLPPIQLTIKYDDIDVSKLYQGKKGRYLNIVLIPTPGNQYNEFMACQSISKEDRDSGERGAILGNANFNKRQGGNQQQQSRPPAAAPKPAPAAAPVDHGEDIDEDVPF